MIPILEHLKKSERSLIIAVDWDDTIAYNDNYGETVFFNEALIHLLVNLKNVFKHKLILWTCREGKWLDEAVATAKQLGLEFDAVNENLPEIEQVSTLGKRKIIADIYIDDRAVQPSDFITIAKSVVNEA